MNQLPMRVMACLALSSAAITSASASADFYDRTHWSETFGQWRHYRIILPRDYETSGKRYPVLYYFHGHSSRYAGEPYGTGQQVSLPDMIDYVQKHDLIAVRWDGYVEEHYTSFYSGSPYDIQQESGSMDFGAYFLELVAHVDSAYRTIPDRQHRATCGLSMGGFMSLFLSGRYPDIIGSASSYNPGHEFYVGPKNARVHYMLKNHVLNHGGGQKIRLIRASGDYISQYHEELNEIYARTPEVDYQYRQEEYHRHWVNNLGETLDFHMRAFEDKSLNDLPRSFNHDNAYPAFSLWGWDIIVENKKAGYVCLRDAQFGYLRVFTRAWAPDGPPVEGQNIQITTPEHYGNRKLYRVMFYNHRNGAVTHRDIRSSERGRLTFAVDGHGYDIAVLNGKEARPPVLLPLEDQGLPVVFPDRDTRLPLRFLNANDAVARNLTFTLTSQYPTVEITGSPVRVDALQPGQVIDLSEHFTQRFVSGSGYFQHCRLNLRVGWQGWHSREYRIDARVLPTPLAEPDSVIVLDGREVTLPLFRQRGNQGGGSIYQKIIREGKGNGNGIAEPGEEVTIWVRAPQGLDPLDKYTWRRAKVFTGDPNITIAADIAEQKELEWTSVKDHTSLILISPDAAPGSEIPLVLQNESYSYVYQPDHRFGPELLYQAFQRHRKHLHYFVLKVGERGQ